MFPSLSRLPSVALFLALAASAATAQSADVSASLPEGTARGQYLATAANCMGCHTVSGQAPFSGGRVFRTPFGTLYSTNITPDAQTGIGGWTDRDFLRALHEGVGRSGEQLYPAFPYTEFTRITEEDALAIKAYLFSLAPVRRANADNDLKFPYSWRPLLRAWKLLNFNPGRYVADPARGPDYNRGHYLAEALGHCNECHTPRNALQGLDGRHHLGGGAVDGWEAYNITPDAASGIGDWSSDDVFNYLFTGRAESRATAAGPMAEVIDSSLRHLSQQDLRAMVAYLMEQPPVRESGALKSRNAFGHADADQSVISAPAADTDRPDGRRLYVAACASCHALTGTGLPGAPGHPGYPGMIGSSVLGARHADNLVLTLLHGVERRNGQGAVYMPPFGADSTVSNALGDEQIAMLSNYLFKQFGNPQAANVTVESVARLRAGTMPKTSALVLTGVLITVCVVVITAFALVWLLLTRHSRAK